MPKDVRLLFFWTDHWPFGPWFVVLALLALPGAVTTARFLAGFIDVSRGRVGKKGFRSSATSSKEIALPTPGEEAAANVTETEAKTRQQKFTMLLLMAAVLLLIAYVVGWSHQPFLLDRNDSHIREYLGDVLLAVAMAAMVSFTFSRVLDLPEVADSIVNKLKSVLESDRHTAYLGRLIGNAVFGDGYLKILRDANKLPTLRQDIDKLLYTNEELTGKDSLYTFVSDRVTDLYSKPYRKDFLVKINCRVEGHWLIWEETTTFTFIHNKKRAEGTSTKEEKEAEVDFRIRDQITPAWREALGKGQPEELLRRTIEDASLMVGESEVGFLVYVFDPENMQLVAKDEAGSKFDAPPRINIQIDAQPQPTDKDFWWGYATEFAFPKELREKPEVKVEWMMRRRKPIRDDMYYLDLRRPTQNVTLVARFPDDIRLEIATFQLFGHADPSLDDDRPRQGFGMARITGWTLPGHGMCLSWYGLKGVPRTDPSPADNFNAERETELPNVAGTSV